MVARGLQDISTLAFDEQLKFTVIFHLFFAHVEQLHSHAKKGMIDPALLGRTYHSLYSYYQFPGVRQRWASIGRAQFSSDFIAFVEDANNAGIKIDPVSPAAQPADAAGSGLAASLFNHRS